jgi:transposase
MNFVAVKSVEQQDIQAVHRVRQLLVHQRTEEMANLQSAPGTETGPWPRLVRGLAAEP